MTSPKKAAEIKAKYLKVDEILSVNSLFSESKGYMLESELENIYCATYSYLSDRICLSKVGRSR